MRRLTYIATVILASSFATAQQAPIDKSSDPYEGTVANGTYINHFFTMSFPIPSGLRTQIESMEALKKSESDKKSGSHSVSDSIDRSADAYRAQGILISATSKVTTIRMGFAPPPAATKSSAPLALDQSMGPRALIGVPAGMSPILAAPSGSTASGRQQQASGPEITGGYMFIKAQMESAGIETIKGELKEEIKKVIATGVVTDVTIAGQRFLRTSYPLVSARDGKPYFWASQYMTLKNGYLVTFYFSSGSERGLKKMEQSMSKLSFAL